MARTSCRGVAEAAPFLFALAKDTCQNYVRHAAVASIPYPGPSGCGARSAGIRFLGAQTGGIGAPQPRARGTECFT
jgi:hypothetical protein